MAVFRVERNTGYTVMSNHHLRNFIFQYPLEAVLKIAEKRREVAA